MGSFWFGTPDEREQARVESVIAQLHRAADRYTATGRPASASAARRLAVEARFMSLRLLTERGRVLLDTLDGSNDGPARAASPLAFAGRHGCLQFTVVGGRLRVDGGTAWRNHNPGYLEYSPFGQDAGAVGFDGRLAVFPDDETGRGALLTFLGTDALQDYTIAELCSRSRLYDDAILEASADAGQIAALSGSRPDTRLHALSREQLRNLANALSDWYLNWTGHEYFASDADAPAWVVEKLQAVPSPFQSETTEQRLESARSRAPRKSVAPDDLCVITSFFNPCGSPTRMRNFDVALQALTASGVHWRCIECAFSNQSFELPTNPNILQVRSESIMWQKERLLNVLIRRLPDQFTKVAWIDCDVLFSNPNWAADTSDALEQHAVVQPFEQVIRLPRDADFSGWAGECWFSFAALYHWDPHSVIGTHYGSHGHTGFAWAGRRQWLEEHQLYDTVLSGTADHLMAHAFVGAWQCRCVFGRLGAGPRRAHFESWCNRLYPSVRSALGRVPGTLFSLWHGSEWNRNYGYYQADHLLDELGYDPSRDLSIGASGAWEWASHKPFLHRWAVAYFSRREADRAAPVWAGEVATTPGSSVMEWPTEWFVE